MSVTMSLRVLRKVEDLDPATAAYLTRTEGFDPDEGWVDNDTVRDEPYTKAIIEATSGFALANEDGDIIREFKTLTSVERAQGSARITFDVSIEGLEDDEE